MIKFTKQASDTNYSKVSAYMIERGFHDIATSNINLLFVISQSEEARDVHDFFSGRNLPMVEGFHDLDASFELIKLGFHKQAFASLRMGLDNGLLAAYWNAVGYDTPEFKRWISSKEQTLHKDKKFWSPIRRICGVEGFYETFSFEQTIKDLTCQLNDYVHTKGFRYSTMGEFQRRIQTQNENIYCDEWYELFVATTRVVVTLQLLVKPKLAIVIPNAYLLRKFGSYDHVPFCGVLLGDYSERIKECIGDAEYDEIAAIANGSPEVEEVRRYLESCPDLTDDEIRELNYEFWKSSGFDEHTIKSYVKDTLRLVREFQNSGRV